MRHLIHLRRTRVAAVLAGATALAGLGAECAEAALTASVSHGTLTIAGDATDDRLALRLAPGSPGTLQLDFGDDGSADRSFARFAFSRIAIQAGAGDDSVALDESNGEFAAQEAISLHDDQDGFDTVAFASSGSEEREFFRLTTAGARFRLVRDVEQDLFESRGVDRVELATKGGDDHVIADDLTSAGIRQTRIDVGADDGADDVVNVIGTSGPDGVEVIGRPGSVTAVGLASSFRVVGASYTDDLLIETVGGRDSMSAATLPPGFLDLGLDGGAGGDEIVGSDGNDFLVGGPGNDYVDADGGTDNVLLGEGNDAFVWHPGDSDDVVDGEEGIDALAFSGSSDAERIDVLPFFSFVRINRDVDEVTLEAEDVERIDLRAGGGDDAITIDDLTPTTVRRVDVDLQGGTNAIRGDTASDTITVRGTDGPDRVTVSGGPLFPTRVVGLAAEVRIANAEYELDLLRLETLGGADDVDASALHAGVIMLLLDGGDGADHLTGSRDADLLAGGAGLDVLVGGPGADTYSCGGPGDLVDAGPGDVLGPDCS